MKIAHLDAFSGLSGDMLLGVLVDAGVPLAHMKRELKKLPVDGYRLTAAKVLRYGIAATKVDVHLTGHGHPARTWKDVRTLIKKSSLPENVREKGLRVFELLFQAEAKVHGVSLDRAHLHELAAVDCIVDIFGTVIGLEYLGVKRLTVSPVNTGSGTVETSHGTLPVPAPATAELLRGFAAYGSGIPFELTTPTGAAVLAGLAAESGPMPVCIPERTAYGAGNRDLQNQPNVLRMTLAAFTESASQPDDSRSTVVMETNIDDMNPQLFEDVMEKLLAGGALDVWLEQIIMKRSRPGTKLCVLAADADVAELAHIVFLNTTTLGVRLYPVERIMLDRSMLSIRLPHGTVRAKVGLLGETVMNTSLEYADLKDLSGRTGIPIKVLAADALRALPSRAPLRRKR